MITCDAHMHTRFSEDSDASVHSMLDAAVNKGMQAVCITDHLDKDFPETSDFPAGAFMFDLDEYFRRLTQLKTEYQKKLEVRIGVEIGLQPHLGEYYKELTEKYPFDFVIGSVHLIHGQDPYYRGFFEDALLHNGFHSVNGHAEWQSSIGREYLRMRASVQTPDPGYLRMLPSASPGPPDAPDRFCPRLLLLHIANIDLKRSMG